MRYVLICAVCCCLAVSVYAVQTPSAEAPVIPLWNGPAPGCLGAQDTDIPTVEVYLPSAAQGPTPAIVICPGGGYDHLAIDYEGTVIAQLFRDRAVAGIVLKYRLPGNGYRHPIPLLDAQRAIRLVRSKAKEWNIDPNQVAILGFSAGGHLASTAGTHFDKPVKIDGGAADAVDNLSCRPDFMVLIYPVISMQDDITHSGSKGNLLGENPPQELVENLSNEKQITDKTPPTFLIHANDDDGVPPENSIRFYEGLRKAGVPAEMHIYLKGGHGFGTRLSEGPAARWPDPCLIWMRQLGILRDNPQEKEAR
jgi:acetyl esterase/lipase